MVGQRTLGVEMVGDVGKRKNFKPTPPLDRTPQSQKDLIKLVLELLTEVIQRYIIYTVAGALVMRELPGNRVRCSILSLL